MVDASTSKMIQYAQSKGWGFKPAGDQIILDNCPYCGKSDHFYAAVVGTKDGLHECKKCQQSGNLYELMKSQGDRDPSFQSQHDWAGKKKVDDLPNPSLCHELLMNNQAALDYLMDTRGFDLDVIQRMKLGIKEGVWFRDLAKESTAIVIPYLKNGENICFAKYRSFPPDAKAFAAPSGWDAPLYNDSVITGELEELVWVEGEYDCISCLSNGLKDVVGVPGAGLKKTLWVDSVSHIQKHYLLYDNDSVGQKGAQELAERLGLEKCFRISLPPFTFVNEKGEEKTGKDINDWFKHGDGTLEKFELLKKAARQFNVKGVKSLGESLDDLEAEYAGKEKDEPRYVTQWDSLNYKLGGFEHGDVIDIIAPGKVGKAQSLNTLLRTETGTVRMGDVQLGTELASVDGKRSVVTGIFPQGVRRNFKLTFSDGRITTASDEHLWAVSHIDGDRKDAVLTTLALKRRVDRGDKWYVPLYSGEWGVEKPVPIHPWLLGVLLGDGDITSPTPAVHKLDPHIREKVSGIVRSYGLCTSDLPSGFRISSGERGGCTAKNPLTECLEELGIHGLISTDKRIPTMYLSASCRQRIELLQGLMDTDGTAGKNGATSFSTSSRALAYQVQELIWSLGGIAEVTSLLPTFTYKGEKKKGQVSYKVSVKIANRRDVFTLPRKRERVTETAVGKVNRLTVVSVEEIEPEEVQCISVSHPSKLYVVDDFVVTHNTTFALNLLDDLVARYKEPGIVICGEMTQARLARKWLSMVTKTDDSPAKTDEEKIQKAQRMREAIPVAKDILRSREEGDLYFGYAQFREIEELYDMMYQARRRYGVRFMVLDNLQLFCDRTLKNDAHRTIHLSKISKMVTGIAKELGLILIRIVQPRGMKEDKIANASDADGSSQIEKDCDASMGLHRSQKAKISASDFEAMGNYMDEESAMEPEMLVDVNRSRYAPGGKLTLLFDGATSSVSEVPRDQARNAQRASAQTSYKSGVMPTEGSSKPASVTLTAAIASLPTEEVTI